MSVTARPASALVATAGRADRLLEWLTVRIGAPDEGEGWLRCADLGQDEVRRWEGAAAEGQRRAYGRSDPTTAAAFVLGWCAGLPGHVGGAFYCLDRRVPRLDPEALAFRSHPEEHHPDGIALLDERFWCLPGDPAAGDPEATVVDGQDALAEILREQVRAHADRFLSWYRPGARLPRRDLLGAFVDGLDTGVWIGGELAGAGRDAVLADGAAVLPGRAGFRDASTLYLLTDDRGATHLTRERISCCLYYRVDDAGEACFTCPRTTAAERRRRAAEWDEEPG